MESAFAHVPIKQETDLLPVVVPLVATNDGYPIGVEGTAFLIAPGWALTAAHVVREYIDRTRTHIPQADLVVPSNHTINPKFELRVGLPGQNAILEMVGARTYSFAAKGDVCLIQLEPTQYDWSRILRYPILQLSPPLAGTAVTAFGLPKTTTQVPANGAVQITMNPTRSNGLVREVHIQQRDSTMLNFPCFQFSGKVLGGMSGGPIINSDGYVCGIVCSSQILEDENLEPISYGTMIWHGMSLPVDGCGGIGADAFRFIDLLDSGIARARDRPHVEIVNRGQAAMATRWNSAV